MQTRECSRNQTSTHPASPGWGLIGSRWAAVSYQSSKPRLGNTLSPFLPLYGHVYSLHTFPYSLRLQTNERHLKGASGHSKVLAQNQRSHQNLVRTSRTEPSAEQLRLGTHTLRRGPKLWGPQIQSSRQNLGPWSSVCSLSPGRMRGGRWT